jgi:hypothetical protein
MFSRQSQQRATPNGRPRAASSSRKVDPVEPAAVQTVARIIAFPLLAACAIAHAACNPRLGTATVLVSTLFNLFGVVAFAISALVHDLAICAPAPCPPPLHGRIERYNLWLLF